MRLGLGLTIQKKLVLKEEKVGYALVCGVVLEEELDAVALILSELCIHHGRDLRYVSMWGYDVDV